MINASAGTHGHIAEPQESVAKRIDHVNDRIAVGQHLPEWWQQLNGVEDSEIGQGCQHKGGDDADIIEALGKHRINQSSEREQGGGQH